MNVVAPVAGVVAEVDQGVADEPGDIGSDPFGEGRLFTLRLAKHPATCWTPWPTTTAPPAGPDRSGGACSLCL